MPARFLSEKDRRLIQELLNDKRQRRVNTPSRPGREQGWTEGEDHQAPEIYIALPPATGIPALTPGEAGEPDIPGVATCEVYKLVNVVTVTGTGTNTTTPVLREVGLQKVVYNISSNEIPSTEEAGTGTGEAHNWVIVKRTKFGVWVVDYDVEGCRYFELAGDLAPGGSAEAWPAFWDSSEEDYITDHDGTKFTVYDILKQFRGRGGDPTGTAPPGSKGKAVYRHGHWEIEKLEFHATLITAIVNEPSPGTGSPSGFTADYITIQVLDVVVTQPLDTALIMGSGQIDEVYNVHKWEGDDGARIVAFWNDSTERWEAIQMDCKD